MGRSVILLEEASASKFVGTKVPNDRQDLRGVIVPVDASVALLPEVPWTLLPSSEATLEHPALRVLPK